MYWHPAKQKQRFKSSITSLSWDLEQFSFYYYYLYIVKYKWDIKKEIPAESKY